MNIENNLLANNISLYDIEKSELFPEWIQNHDFGGIDNSYLEVQGGVRYLVLDEQYHIESDKVTKFCRSIKQPINMQGVEESSKFLIEFNPINNKLKINKVCITRKDQKINKLCSIDMQLLRREYKAEANILSGNMTLSVILDDVKEDDIIEFVYTIVNQSEIEAQFFGSLFQLEYGVPLHALYLTFISEKNIAIQHQFLGEKAQVQEIAHDDKNILILSRKNIPGKNFNHYIPYWYQQLSCANVTMKKSWDEIALVVASYYPLIKIDPQFLNNFIRNEKINDSSKENIVLNILSFITKNIRYLSNYKATDYIKPADPNVVIKRAYGDCKDFVHLFRNLLTAYGIPSYPVLVHTQFGKDLCNYFPSMSSFNHVILAVSVNNERYFIDPTIRQDVNSLKNLYLPDYGYGLICSEKSENVVYVENLISSPSYISVSDEYRMISWKDNHVIFISKTTMHGIHALRLKQFLENNSENKFIESLKNYYSKILNIKEITGIEKDMSHVKSNVITFSINCRASINVHSQEADRYLVEVLPTDILDRLYYQLPLGIDSDFYFGEPIKIDYDIIFIDSQVNVIGEDWSVVSDESFKLSKNSVGSEGGYRIKYQFEKLRETIPSNKYVSFCSKNKEAIRILPAFFFTYKNKNKKRNKLSIAYMIYFFIMLFLIAAVISHWKI